jgi:predicted amidohydrolase
MSTRIACCQIAPDVDDPAGNEALTRDAIQAAVAGGAQIVVLPELATSGYVFRSAEEARAAAIPADGDLLRRLGEAAAVPESALVVCGFAELAADGRVFNSVALLDGSEVLATYRKLHLWGDEPRWFSAGEDPAAVVQTRYGRIGLAICYDLEFPELTRGLALQGAELIALPANWPHEEPLDGRPVLHSLAAMTAYFNKVFVAVCDRCGIERGSEFEGGSVIAGPVGSLLAGPVQDRGSQTLYADCELGRADDKRNGKHNDAFADRRPEQYAAALHAD